jgi:cytidylate kinase
MAIITISRGSFSGGKLVAECLASNLGHRCLDRDTVVEKAAQYGASPKDLLDALVKAPGYIDRTRHKRYVYLATIQAALAEEVKGGKTVYHGNAGHLLLKAIGHVLRVRIIAPMEYRLTALRERMPMDRSEALTYIARVDEERRRWTRYLYGVSWEDPELYDAVLNLEHMDIPEACDLIGTMAQAGRFKETPELLAAAQDLALASSVRAQLAVNPATSSLEVEVTAFKGTVYVRGPVSSRRLIERIQEIAAGAAGVQRVNVELLAVDRETRTF